MIAPNGFVSFKIAFQALLAVKTMFLRSLADWASSPLIPSKSPPTSTIMLGGLPAMGLGRQVSGYATPCQAQAY